ncbi:hypothetical protein FRC00_000338, partial [Tulasnella sp. 408]
MSSLYGAIDMDSIKMDGLQSPFQMAGLTNNQIPSSSAGGDNMGVGPSMTGFDHHHHLAAAAAGQAPSSYDFTDPTILSQLRDMENDVKFATSATLDPTAFLAQPPPSGLPAMMAASSSSSLTVSSTLSNPNSLMAPLPFYESKPSPSATQLVAPSPPSTQTSGHSPPTSHPGAGPSPPSGSVPKPSFVDMSVIPSGMSSMASPISPTMGQHSVASSNSPGSQAVTATGVALGGVISTRHGSQVTVGSVVASVLDNVVQMASQARDAYLAGKQDQTHAQIEELLESLKLVGGLGVGPSIGAISSNMPHSEGGEDALMQAPASAPLEGRASLGASVAATGSPNALLSLMGCFAGPSPPAAPSHRSGSSPQQARLGGSANNSPGSSVSPPQRMSQPLPMGSLAAPNSVQEMLGASPAHALSISPSPPSMASTSSLAAALGPLPPMEDGPGSLAIGQPPSTNSFDPARKRTASSAPTLIDNPRGPAKITKRSPSVEAADEVNALASASPSATSSMMSGIQSTVAAPPLLHAHTFPASLPQAQLAGAATQIPFPVGSLAPGGSPMAATLVAGNPNVMPAQPSGYPGASVSSLSGWTTTNAATAGTDSPVHGSPTPGVVIPPPHHPSSVISRRFSSEALRGSPLNPGVGPSAAMGSSQAFAPALYPSGLPDGLVQSLPMAAGGGLIPTSLPGAGMSSMMDVDVGASGMAPLGQFVDVALPGSRPGTSHGRPSLPDHSSSSSTAFGSFNTPDMQHQSSQDDPVDDDSDDDGDSDDGDEGRTSNPSSVNGSVNGSRRMEGGRSKRKGAGSGAEGSNSANALSPEVKAVVDRVFVEYLNRICSNLDATDSKGEAIHQTLMAKKMARLDESPDFRPFKFRIQAFTNGFVEELARQGYGEEQIPIKKIKAYLWHHNPYIARFNEDGKKAKSKGNHIWNIEAKKVMAPNGDPNAPRWVFKKFVRKIAGAPPTMAYIGLKWQPPLVSTAALPPPAPNPAETAQVIAVINNAANRVAAAAQTQGFPTGPAQAHAQAALAKQQQVLTVAAQVISSEAHDALVGRAIGEQPKASSVLVQAAQAVVHQAARQVQADKTAVALLQAKSSPVAPIMPAPVSLTDVSIATQSAVAHAVAITGSESSEVE